jgi:hypothetical protein
MHVQYCMCLGNAGRADPAPGKVKKRESILGMTTTHIIASSMPSTQLTGSSGVGGSGSSVVGVHYRVGKKIGEGSFGVIFEGTHLPSSPSTRSLMSNTRYQPAEFADSGHQIRS